MNIIEFLELYRYLPDPLGYFTVSTFEIELCTSEYIRRLGFRKFSFWKSNVEGDIKLSFETENISVTNTDIYIYDLEGRSREINLIRKDDKCKFELIESTTSEIFYSMEFDVNEDLKRCIIEFFDKFIESDKFDKLVQKIKNRRLSRYYLDFKDISLFRVNPSIDKVYVDCVEGTRFMLDRFGRLLELDIIHYGSDVDFDREYKINKGVVKMFYNSLKQTFANVIDFINHVIDNLRSVLNVLKDINCLMIDPCCLNVHVVKRPALTIGVLGRRKYVILRTIDKKQEVVIFFKGNICIEYSDSFRGKILYIITESENMDIDYLNEKLSKCLFIQLSSIK